MGKFGEQQSGVLMVLAIGELRAEWTVCSSVVWAADPREEVPETFAMPGSAAQRNLRRREKHRFELYCHVAQNV